MSSLVNNSKNQPCPVLLESDSTQAQQEAELECKPYFMDISQLPPDQQQHLRQTGLLGPQGMDVHLLKQKHAEYLSQVWKTPLKHPFVSLDASRPWMLYWCLHGCDLLGDFPSDEYRTGMVLTLEKCWKSTTVSLPAQINKEGADSLLTSTSTSTTRNNTDNKDNTYEAGGFGGGPGQMAHAATSYAAILSLCIIASSEKDKDGGGESSKLAYDLLERIRSPLYAWFLSLQQPNGGYRMHHDGEIDVRASYTIICCAKLLNLVTPNLCHEQVIDFIASCQTYEGGIGAEPFTEAHGGYAYCGVSALKLVNRLDALDTDALTGWLARRHMSYEGGFSGRSNKLVDGCYSFWQGGGMAIASSMYDDKGGGRQQQGGGSSRQDEDEDPWLTGSPPTNLLFDAPMLERYILLCAQDVHGGLRDKPSKSRDFYHSCYNLSGLSVAQHYSSGGEEQQYGDPLASKVLQTHPCYNIRVDRVQTILKHFASK
jgi:protein farnesyltransferase subunit beta